MLQNATEGRGDIGYVILIAEQCRVMKRYCPPRHVITRGEVEAFWINAREVF